MPAGYPVKVNYLTGDVLTAADLNDLAGTVNFYDPTAKGDLFPATAADAVSRLAVGANATVLTADSTAATGMKWAAGAGGGVNPNIIINGNFTINQRDYVSAATLASGVYGFDRWKSNAAGTTLTYTSAPQGQSVTINSTGGITQIIEQANVIAGSYTLSWTGTATARIYNVGATPTSYAASPVSFTADGAANVQVDFTASGGTKTCSLIKLESGTSATTFNLAGGTIESELANCQRYYWQNLYFYLIPGGFANSTTLAYLTLLYPNEMRIAPTVTLTAGGFEVFVPSNIQTSTAAATTYITVRSVRLNLTTSGLTAGYGVFAYANGGSVKLDAEL